MTLVLSGRIARGGTLRDGWIEIERGRVTEVRAGRPPRTPDEHHDGIVAPGLCDIQVNGGAGHEVTGGSAALDAIDALELAHGVTSYLPTLVTTDASTAERAVAELEARVADPRSPVAGVHLEGPFLSPAHAGVHRAELMAVPADGVPSYYASSAVRLVTLSPELPGALELVRDLRARGVTVSLGHSGADAALVRAAIDAGAAMVTHVFNAMEPLHHRAPGIVGTALLDARVRVCVIADGLHVDPPVLELVRRLVGRRVVLVTDATPAAGAPEGRYEMAGGSIPA